MKKLIYILAGFLLMTVSCGKKLNLSNPNALTTVDYWKTKDQAFAGVTAIYNSLTQDGTYMRSFPGLTDSRGDDFTGDSSLFPLLQLLFNGSGEIFTRLSTGLTRYCNMSVHMMPVY